ncbi:MAG TPA: ABC transporter permease [Gammaproteobacteria bacterium]|nr:ABC transporter permease [Gammaproteobacteria bacterium]|tara:strand:+ start:9052 stop:10140 length:1089 start_codon:yes stop_codon:yes gene_type:complete
MFKESQIHLAMVFLKMFLRDIQSMLFNLFFPMAFIGVFIFTGGEPDPIKVGVIDRAQNQLSVAFSSLLEQDETFDIVDGSESDLSVRLIDGELIAIVEIPEQFDYENQSGKLNLILDASQVRQLDGIKDSIEKTLLSIERELRGNEAMFALEIVDMKARPQRYIDFLIPGLLAFMLMNLSIAGSGFNLVEYRRRGILKRLFVTPIMPKDFIVSIVLARLVIVLIQLSVVLWFALLVLDIQLIGGLASLYGMIMLGSLVFLCFGFCFGSIAKTQEAIRPLVTSFTFPQLILSGVFFPISSLPEIIQPIAEFLPLSVITSSLRGIANDGLSLLSFDLNLLGVLIWLIISFFIATRYFVWRDVAG